MFLTWSPRRYAKNALLLVALHETHLLSLDLPDCGLCAVPEALQSQTQLTSLSLTRNGITELPVWLGSLRQLQRLAVKGNPLRQPFAK
jgi:Leucine-rich repeat (LRR) protein